MTGSGTERVSAVVVAVALLGFFAWVLLTLPIQPALILVVAGTLAWVGWVTTSYAHPVRSRKVIATYQCSVSFQLIHMGAGGGGRPLPGAHRQLHAVVLRARAGLLNAVAHFVFPVLKGGYFPGLWTAGGHLVLSALLVYFLVQESGRRKAEARLARPSLFRWSCPGRVRPWTLRAS